MKNGISKGKLIELNTGLTETMYKVACTLKIANSSDTKKILFIMC